MRVYVSVCARESACVRSRVYVYEKERIFVCLRLREGVCERCVCVCVNESVRACVVVDCLDYLMLYVILRKKIVY